VVVYRSSFFRVEFPRTHTNDGIASCPLAQSASVTGSKESYLVEKGFAIAISYKNDHPRRTSQVLRINTSILHST
jgi:hypothetical protein